MPTAAPGGTAPMPPPPGDFGGGGAKLLPPGDFSGGKSKIELLREKLLQKKRAQAEQVQDAPKYAAMPDQARAKLETLREKLLQSAKEEGAAQVFTTKFDPEAAPAPGSATTAVSSEAPLQGGIVLTASEEDFRSGAKREALNRLVEDLVKKRSSQASASPASAELPTTAEQATDFWGRSKGSGGEEARPSEEKKVQKVVRVIRKRVRRQQQPPSATTQEEAGDADASIPVHLRTLQKGALSEGEGRAASEDSNEGDKSVPEADAAQNATDEESAEDDASDEDESGDDDEDDVSVHRMPRIQNGKAKDERSAGSRHAKQKRLPADRSNADTIVKAGRNKHVAREKASGKLGKEEATQKADELLLAAQERSPAEAERAKQAKQRDNKLQRLLRAEARPKNRSRPMPSKSEEYPSAKPKSRAGPLLSKNDEETVKAQAAKPKTLQKPGRTDSHRECSSEGRRSNPRSQSSTHRTPAPRLCSRSRDSSGRRAVESHRGKTDRMTLKEKSPQPYRLKSRSCQRSRSADRRHLQPSIPRCKPESRDEKPRASPPRRKSKSHSPLRKRQQTSKSRRRRSRSPRRNTEQRDARRLSPRKGGTRDRGRRSRSRRKSASLPSKHRQKSRSRSRKKSNSRSRKKSRSRSRKKSRSIPRKPAHQDEKRRASPRSKGRSRDAPRSKSDRRRRSSSCRKTGSHSRSRQHKTGSRSGSRVPPKEPGLPKKIMGLGREDQRSRSRSQKAAPEPEPGLPAKIMGLRRSPSPPPPKPPATEKESSSSLTALLRGTEAPAAAKVQETGEAELVKFPAFSYVSLKGLKVNVDLNDLAGIIVPSELTSQMVPGTLKVRLETEREIAVRPANLDLVLGGASALKGPQQEKLLQIQQQLEVEVAVAAQVRQASAEAAKALGLSL